MNARQSARGRPATRTLWISTIALAIGLVANGCTTSTADTNRLCTPGAYVLCKCADGAAGTKQCDASGQSFAECALPGGDACKGGEVPSDTTGTPVTSDNDPRLQPIPANDCPGQAKTIVAGTTATFTGDTTSATIDRSGKSGGACAVSVGSVDQIYHLVPDTSGVLHVKVQGAADGLDPVVYLRTVCDDQSAQAACGPPTSKNLAQLTAKVAATTDYYLYIDGASSTKGAFTATLDLTAQAFCGDGLVDNGEACDDKNKNEGDGCSNDCHNANGNPASGNSCPGQPIDIWTNGSTVSAQGSTAAYVAGAWDGPDATCSKTGTNTYKDHIYQVTPHAAGTLVVTVSAASGTSTVANFMLSARSTCADASTQIACVNDALSNGGETLTFPVAADQPVYVGVDGGGLTNNTGDYTISFKLQ